MIHITITNGDEVIVDTDAEACIYSYADRASDHLCGGSQVAHDLAEKEDIFWILATLCGVVEKALGVIDHIFDMPDLGEFIKGAVGEHYHAQSDPGRS